MMVMLLRWQLHAGTAGSKDTAKALGAPEEGLPERTCCKSTGGPRDRSPAASGRGRGVSGVTLALKVCSQPAQRVRVQPGWPETWACLRPLSLRAGLSAADENSSSHARMAPCVEREPAVGGHRTAAALLDNWARNLK